MIIRLAVIILIGSTLSACTSFLDKIRYTDKYPRQFDEKNNTVIIHTHFDRDLNLLKPSQPFLTFQVSGGTWVRPGRGGTLGIDIAEKDGAMTLFTPAGHRVRFRWHWLGSQIYARYKNKMPDTYVWMSGRPTVETGKKPAIRSHVIWERHRFLTKKQIYCNDYIYALNDEPKWDASNPKKQNMPFRYEILCPFRTDRFHPEVTELMGREIETTGLFAMFTYLPASGHNQEELDASVDQAIAEVEVYLLPILDTLTLPSYMYQFKPTQSQEK